MKTVWLAAASILTAAVGACQRDAQINEKETPTQDRTAAAAQQTPPNAPTAANSASIPAHTITLPGVASCRPESEFTNTLSRLVSVADSNGDAQVSKQEAYAATNFLIGGFFFRSDTNSDGQVTPEEGREARTELMRNHPALATLLREARDVSGKSPLAALGYVLDINYQKPVTVPEARDMTRSAVDSLFAMVDSDHDNAINMNEAQAAGWQAARGLGNTAFKAADTTHDGHLNLDEFRQALSVPTKMAFNMADSNNDGQLTLDEASTALGYLTKRLGMHFPESTPK